jgi:hypothetical protein
MLVRQLLVVGCSGQGGGGTAGGGGGVTAAQHRGARALHALRKWASAGRTAVVPPPAAHYGEAAWPAGRGAVTSAEARSLPVLQKAAARKATMAQASKPCWARQA